MISVVVLYQMITFRYDEEVNILRGVSHQESRVLFGAEPAAHYTCLPRRRISCPPRFQKSRAQSQGMCALRCVADHSDHAWRYAARARHSMSRSQSAEGQRSDNVVFRVYTCLRLGSDCNLTSGNIAVAEHAVCNLPWSKKMGFAMCRRSIHGWSAKQPKLNLHVVSDEQGRPLEDAGHLTGIFQMTEDDSQDCSRESIVDNVPRAPGDLLRTSSRDDVDYMLARRRSTHQVPTRRRVIQSISVRRGNRIPTSCGLLLCNSLGGHKSTDKLRSQQNKIHGQSPTPPMNGARSCALPMPSSNLLCATAIARFSRRRHDGVSSSTPSIFQLKDALQTGR